jgi:hypothetical protein
MQDAEESGYKQERGHGCEDQASHHCGFIGNAYLPAGFDNLTHAGQRSAIAFGGIAAQNVLQEFSPELGQFLKKIHLPHIPTPPVWWTGDK